MKHGHLVFSLHGPLNKTNLKLFQIRITGERWRDGKTGMPIIDALMRQLNATGYIS